VVKSPTQLTSLNLKDFYSFAQSVKNSTDSAPVNVLAEADWSVPEAVLKTAIPLAGMVFNSPSLRRATRKGNFRMETNTMLQQLLDAMLEQQGQLCELGRNDLLLIESCRPEVSPEVLAVAAATVRSTLYSVDALSDKLRSLSEQVRNQ
jgi:hypothetical protein